MIMSVASARGSAAHQDGWRIPATEIEALVLETPLIVVIMPPSPVQHGGP
ncbi:hypothetical protein ACFPLB_11960 [Aquamicrobium segne]|uniref:Uncharacterized protein n=1 Tax=Aquamicrobium segne TaxID=469547 RepID=A0ABW0GYD4_9HYPH